MCASPFLLCDTKKFTPNISVQAQQPVLNNFMKNKMQDTKVTQHSPFLSEQMVKEFFELVRVNIITYYVCSMHYME